MANSSPSFANIPEELLEGIFVRVASSNVRDAASLGMVSRVFYRHWNTIVVRHNCNFGSLDFVPAIGNNGEIRSLVEAMARFCLAENPDALYREGLTSLLDNRRQGREFEGLTNLEAAANKGHMQARFFFGLILVCTCVVRRNEGFNLLSTLMQLTLLESMGQMARLREDLNSNYLARLEGGRSKVLEILVEYHSACNCDDPDGNQDYMDDAFGWPYQTLAFDPPNDPMCKQCFWDRETNILFHTLYESLYNPFLF